MFEITDFVASCRCDDDRDVDMYFLQHLASFLSIIDCDDELFCIQVWLTMTQLQGIISAV